MVSNAIQSNIVSPLLFWYIYEEFSNHFHIPLHISPPMLCHMWSQINFTNHWFTVDYWFKIFFSSSTSPSESNLCSSAIQIWSQTNFLFFIPTIPLCACTHTHTHYPISAIHCMGYNELYSILAACLHLAYSALYCYYSCMCLRQCHPTLPACWYTNEVNTITLSKLL